MVASIAIYSISDDTSQMMKKLQRSIIRRYGEHNIVTLLDRPPEMPLLATLQVAIIILGPHLSRDARALQQLEGILSTFRTEGKLIVPILIDGAAMPPTSMLPAALQWFHETNAKPVHPQLNAFLADLQMIYSEIDKQAILPRDRLLHQYITIKCWFLLICMLAWPGAFVAPPLLFLEIGGIWIFMTIGFFEALLRQPRRLGWALGMGTLSFFIGFGVYSSLAPEQPAATASTPATAASAQLEAWVAAALHDPVGATILYAIMGIIVVGFVLLGVYGLPSALIRLERPHARIAPHFAMKSASGTRQRRFVTSLCFISYRRKEDDGICDRLERALRYRFADVFLDRKTIMSGATFPIVTRTFLSRSEAVIVLIGKDWIAMRHPNGQRRLDDPHDFVRQEIMQAISEEKMLLPVLLDDAPMPTADELPDVLKQLASYPALPIHSNDRFDADVGMISQTLWVMRQQRRDRVYFVWLGAMVLYGALLIGLFALREHLVFAEGLFHLTGFMFAVFYGWVCLSALVASARHAEWLWAGSFICLMVLQTTTFLLARAAGLTPTLFSGTIDISWVWLLTGVSISSASLTLALCIAFGAGIRRIEIERLIQRRYSDDFVAS